jgi:predicted amidohydrolase YtcJ
MHAGIFVDSAMDLVPIPESTEAQMTRYFETVVHDALSVGLTSIHDAFSTPDMITFFKKYVNIFRGKVIDIM